MLTKTTWKLKTPGGILVFRVLVQNCGGIRMFLRGGVLSIFQLPSYNGLDINVLKIWEEDHELMNHYV